MVACTGCESSGGKHMVSDLYDVTGIPHFVLIDREGS